MKVEVEISDEDIEKLVRELLTKKIYDYIDYKTPVESLINRVLTEEIKTQIKKRLDKYFQEINVLNIIKAEVKRYIEERGEEVIQNVARDLIKHAVLKK
ncbi:MAG: hypothetical protein ACTSXW_08510 [Candidatus Baldrarchaeia archaeon]